MLATLYGIPIGYDVTGQGIPLMFLHAFPLDRSMFRPLPGARLITFDAPGAGESGLPPGDLSMEAVADIAAGLLDLLGIEKAVVGGISMGAYAAFRFVCRHPRRLLGLILSDTRAAADSAEGRKARYEMMEAARSLGSAEIARRMLPRLLGETTRRENPALVEQVRLMIGKQDPEGIARLLEALAERTDSTALLKQITVPTLVVAGEEDVIATVAESSEMAKRIPGARLAIIPKAGHLPNLEQPERFEKAVESFLQEIGRE
ncbi:MAG TPA: alpha/beta fold hydrolase [Bryobacterales bacterium]|jgi:3-oxoadipate enol-lactonase|nr:alpha/beta fold hydrolase [Bryobacterales bacterium]